MRGSIEDNSKIFFSHFSTKTYIATPQQNRLDETVLMIGHKICFKDKCGLLFLNYP